MTIPVANLDITTDTFGTWVSKTNTIATLVSNNVVTVDATASGNSSTGNGTIIGRFGANTLFATTALRGGNVATADTLTISSNLSVTNTTTISGAVTLLSTLNTTGLATFTNNVAASGITTNTAAIGNVSINTTSVSITGIGVTVSAIANSTVARITVGNSTVNATHVAANNGYFSGNLTVDGTFLTTSDLSVSGDLLVPVSNTYDVGNATSTFRTGYFNLIDATNLDASNSVYIGTTVVNSSVLQSSSLFTVNTTSNTVGAASFANTVTVTGLTTLNNLNASTANTTAINVGANVNLTTTNIKVGNSTSNVTVSNSSVVVGANVSLTTASISIGNSTVNTFANSTAIDIDGTLAVLNSVSFSNTLTVTGLSSLGNINASTANTTAINVGANVNITTANIKVGNTTANVTISNNSINVDGATVNSTVYTGTANNTSNFNGQAASFYTNATNLSTGTVPTARLGASTANSSTFLRGDQSYATAVTSVTGGAGLSGTVTTTGSLAVNANNGLIANSTGLYVDAEIGLVANATGLHVNAAYIATISANNALFLNGQADTYYTNATNLSTGTVPSGRLTGTYSISINGNANTATTALTANNSTNLNGQAASYYTDIAARLGYTPVNKAGDTVTGNLTINGTVLTDTIRFRSDTSQDTGISWGGEGIINFVTNNTYRGSFDGSGNFAATGNITAYASDKRLKKNIRPVSQTPLADLLKLSGVRFDWRDDTAQPMRGTDVGLIAQEVEEVLPEAVTAAPFDNTYKTIKMNQQIGALMIEAIRELTDEVTKLKAKIAILEGNNS